MSYRRQRSYGQAQIDVINAVIQFKQDNNGNAPSLLEIAEMLGLSKSTVQTTINAIIASPRPSHPATLERDDVGRIIVKEGEFKMKGRE